MQDENQKAADWGIEPGHRDVFGTWRAASPAAIEALAVALSRNRTTPVVDPPARPAFAYQNGSKRMWALAVQLYAVRSDANWGHGDFGDLKALIALAADAGASAIVLNPLHALFPERAEDASPYSPNSRLFLNCLYIDLAALPECPGLDVLELDAEIAALRASETVAYARVARAKLAALRGCYRTFLSARDPERLADFGRFRAEKGEWLTRFAAFEVLRERFGTGAWWTWPQRWRRPDADNLAALRASDDEALGFHCYVQWNADRQLRTCQRTARDCGMPVGLIVDLAVGVDPGGADAWSMQDDILGGVSVGAPPDRYNPSGQNWGVNTFNPHALIAGDFEPMRRMLRAAMAHAGAIRIDHVLGLMRLYLIPNGMSAQNGAYVRFPLQALLCAIAEESVRHRCIVIGEDLGTVPEGFVQTVAQWGLWSYAVMLFEREHDGAFRAPERYPANALATFSTHDLPTFAGWMTGQDLVLKRSIGVNPGETNNARKQSRTRLRAALKRHAGGDDFAAVARYLAQSPAKLVAVALEDILGMVDQINIPSTVAQYPNWRVRMPVSLERLADDPTLKKIAAVFAQTGRGCG